MASQIYLRAWALLSFIHTWPLFPFFDGKIETVDLFAVFHLLPLLPWLFFIVNGFASQNSIVHVFTSLPLGDEWNSSSYKHQNIHFIHYTKTRCTNLYIIFFKLTATGTRAKRMLTQADVSQSNCHTIFPFIFSAQARIHIINQKFNRKIFLLTHSRCAAQNVWWKSHLDNVNSMNSYCAFTLPPPPLPRNDETEEKPKHEHLNILN